MRSPGAGNDSGRLRARLDPALDGAEVVVLATSTEDVASVATRASSAIASTALLAGTSKGLLKDAAGAVQVPPTYLAGLFASIGHAVPQIVAVGGLCKANEVAAGRPTARASGSTDLDSPRRAGRLMQTDMYRVELTEDVIGLEVSAPLKNVDAIALGSTDGLSETTGEHRHHLQSAIFRQSPKRIRRAGPVPVEVGLPGRRGGKAGRTLQGRRRLVDVAGGARCRSPEKAARHQTSSAPAH